MAMALSFPPCEGQGPDLSVTFIDTPVTGKPMVISANGEKGYLIPYGSGCLLLTNTNQGPNAYLLFKQLIPPIVEGYRAGWFASINWHATTQTAASFRRWVDKVIHKWRLQLQLEQAIQSGNASGITAAIKAGADQNAILPCGDLPMVLAVKYGLTAPASMPALRRYPVDESQWRAAADAAADADATIRAMIQEQHTPIPKPLLV